MPSFLALLTFLLAAGVHVERVSVSGPNGIKLDAALVLPEGAAKMPPVVGLCGCGGPFPSRDGQWAVVLAKAGHLVLLPDSFGSRGLGSQCARKEREVTPSGPRRQDAIDAAQWLVARPGMPSFLLPEGGRGSDWNGGRDQIGSLAAMRWKSAHARVAPGFPHPPRGVWWRPRHGVWWRNSRLFRGFWWHTLIFKESITS